MHLVIATRTKQNKLALLKTAKLGKEVLILHVPSLKTSTDVRMMFRCVKIQVRMLLFHSEILVNIWHSYLRILLLKGKYNPEHCSHHPDPIYINQVFIYQDYLYLPVLDTYYTTSTLSSYLKTQFIIKVYLIFWGRRYWRKYSE